MLGRMRGVMMAALAGPGLVAATVIAGGETAEYTMSFEATWSAETHPVDFPSGAHFSGLIGGTHNGDVAFWEEGEIASTGIEQMAETGSKTILRSEVQAAIGDGTAGEVIDGSGISESPGMASADFMVTRDFPLATIVTMIAPSPDWFAGVNGLSLLVDDDWVDELVVVLYPYDAGTDSGISYRSPNEDTQPADPIAEIVGYPFLNKDDVVAPIGTFTFTRTDVDPCPGDVDDDDDVDFDDLLAILAAWGNEGGPEDLDDSGLVDFGDVLIVLAGWGSCDG